MSTTEIPYEEEAATPSSTLDPEALAAFADEEEPDDEAPRPSNPDMDDVLKDVPERTWKVAGKLTISRRQGRQIIQSEEGFEREYVQKPLSYLSMMQFTGLLGRKLDELMSGPEGVSMGELPSLMSVPDMVSMDSDGKVSFDLTQGDFSGVDSLVRGFAKLASHFPEIVAEAQCIWLRVPPRDRMAVIDIWDRPVDEGGLSLDEGGEMFELFIHQNYEELERFFLVWVRKWAKRLRRERSRLHPDEEG